MGVNNITSKFRGPLLIIGLVILANILFITGVFKSNPVDNYSGASVSGKVGIYGVYSTIDPNIGFTTQTLGHQGAEDIVHGNMPWWNYNEQVGAPLAGGMQSASLFLPFNLLMILTNGVLYFHIVLEIISGIGTYYLLRKLKLSETVSVLGGMLFAINGTFAWFGSANVNPIAFMPLLILGIEIALEKTKNKKSGGWVIIALALAFSIYSGFPEGAYLDGTLAGIWFLVRAIQERHSDWYKFTLKVIYGILVGLLLSMPILISFIDYLPFANIGGHSGSLSTYALPISNLPALVMPYIFGPIFQFNYYDHSSILLSFWDNVGGFISITTIYLAIIGLLTAKKKNKPILYMLGIFSFVVITRTYGLKGMDRLVNLIPGMKQVAFYRYASPTLELSIIILAMFGFEALLNRKKEEVSKKKITYISCLMLLAIFILSVEALSVYSNLYLLPHRYFFFILSIAWEVVGLLAIVATLIYFRKYTKIVIPVVLLCGALIMFIAPEPSAPRSSVQDLKPINYIKNHIGNYRFYSIAYLQPNYGTYYGAAEIDTNNEPVVNSWTKYITKNLNSNVNPSQGFNGLNQLSQTGDTPIQAFLVNLKSYSGIGVKYVVIKNGILAENVASKFSLKPVFWDSNFTVYELPNLKPYFQTIEGNCSLTSPNKYTLFTNCSEASVIQRQEVYMKGWMASINGKSEAVSKSGPLFQKINVPKGKSTVIFNYTPPYIVLGYIAFIAGALIIVYKPLKTFVKSKSK